MAKYEFDLSVGIKEVLDADSAQKVEKEITDQKKRLEEPIELTLSISDAKKRFKELEKEAKKVQKLLNQALSVKNFDGISQYTKQMSNIQREQEELLVIIGKQTKAISQQSDAIRGVDAAEKRRKKTVDSITSATEDTVAAIKEQAEAINQVARAEAKLQRARKTKAKAKPDVVKTAPDGDSIDKKVREVEGAYKTLGEVVAETKRAILGTDFDHVFSAKTVEEYAEALTKVRDKIAEIKDAARDAKREYDDIVSTISSYTGAHLGAKTDFQKAIKDAWTNGDHAMSAKLFESYQKRFPTGKFDPSKQFGTEWSENFSKYLEEANRNLSFFRTQLKRAGEDYGKFMALDTLQDYETRLNTGYQRALAERAAAEKKAAESTRLLEKAQKDFATDDLTVAQKNLNAAIDEYNARLAESNRLLAEKRRLEDLDSYEGESWYKEGELPVNHIVENAAQFAEAADAVDLYRIALKEAVRVYRELGGDMKLPFDDEALLKEIDIPVRIVPTVETSGLLGSETIDEDELEIIKKENGALEDKLELLQEIAEQYANTVTQKNREKYEELNQKDMDGGLTSRQEERFWELGEAIDEADRQIEEFGQTYSRVILKLANGKKIEILPDDAGLRKFDKIANEYYGGEYNGIEIEDVIFERVQAVTGAILEQADATEQLAEAHEKLNNNAAGNKNIMSYNDAAKWSNYAEYSSLREEEDQKYLEEHGTEVLSGLEDRIRALADVLKPVNEMVSRISKNASVKDVPFDKMRQEAADVAKTLATMYDDGIRDTEEYVTLQYRLIHLLDTIGKGYGGVKGSGARDVVELRSWAMDGIHGETGYNINASDAIDALWGQGRFSIFENSTQIKTMLELAGKLLDYKGMDFTGGFGAKFDKAEYKRLQSTLKVIREIVNESKTAREAKMSETAKLIGDLQSKYSDKFQSIFGGTLDSFGGLDVSNATAVYDALIAKEQEYKLEIQKRMDALGAFTTNVNSSFQQYAELEGFMAKVTDLSNLIVGGDIGLEDATRQLQEFVEVQTKAAEIEAVDENKEGAKSLDELEKKYFSIIDTIETYLKLVEKLNTISGTGPRDMRNKIIEFANELPEDVAAMLGEKFAEGLKNSFKGISTIDLIELIKAPSNANAFGALQHRLDLAKVIDFDNIKYADDGSIKLTDSDNPFEWLRSIQGQLPILTELYVTLNAIAEAKQQLIAAERETVSAVTETTDSIQQQKLAIDSVESGFGKDMLRGLHLDDFFKQWRISGNERKPIKQEIYKLAELLKDAQLGGSPEQFEAQYHKVIEMLNGACKSAEEFQKTYKEFYDWMNGRKFSYDPADDEKYAQEFKDSWGQIKQAHSYWLVSSEKNKTASHVDAFYAEAVSKFPGLFSEDVINPYDQMRALLEAIDAGRDEKKMGDKVKTEEIELALTEAFDNDIFVPVIQAVTKAVADIRASAENAKDDIESVVGAGSKSSKDSVSVEDLIARDMDRALSQLRSAKNNETTLFTLKGVFEGEDLVKQAQAMVKNIAEQANLSLASFSVKDDIIRVKLYNDELNVTVDQMYRLRQATEDMESAQLELVSQSFTQNVKALNENNFDTEGIRQRALASIEKVRSSLHGLEYDLTDLENAAKNISSQDDFTKFNNQLKAAQDNIQAIKNATVSKSSMNPLANMQRDMQNASIEIETMRLKLEKFGDIQGVTEARQMLEGMTAAAEQYNKAADAQGQQAAYNQYSNLRSSFKAQTEYINAAKALNESQKSTEKKTDPIRQQYQAILDLINKINTKSAEITKYQNKDGGSGIFAGHISQLQAEKAKLVSELQGITDEINNALSGGFVQGKEISVPFASILDGSGAISSFLNDTKTQASLTTEEIEKLVAALQKSQNLDINAATKVAEQFKSVQETYKRLSELTGVDQSNESYQALGGLYRQIVEYKNKLSADPMSWTSEESSHLQALISQFTQYGNKLADVAEKEAKYFSGKTKYSQDTTMGMMTQKAAEEAQKLGDVQQKLEEAARKFAQESGAGNAFITNFTQGADGISKLDFSVFDTATNSMRNFRMEMGSVTEGMFVTETTVSKSLANIQAAQKQMQSASSLIGKLSASGVNVSEDNASAQVSKLLNLYKQLSAEIAKGDAADQNTITKLTSDLKMASSQTEKFYKQMIQMEDAIASGKAKDLGLGDPKGNIYGQLVDEANKLAEAERGVAVETGRFDETTNTLNASLIHANGTVESIQLSMNGLNGQMVVQQTGVTKLTDSWDRFKAGVAQAGKHLMTALVGYNAFFKVVSEVRKGIGYVKEIDLALTELKKVTDETEASYRKFLDTAAGMAGEIGSTVSDFTEASANFARLGYTMEESADMAKTAIVYKNVADGLDTVEESTDSIISTMKAFGIESDNTMGIVDRFNEVGKYIAQIA